MEQEPLIERLMAENEEFRRLRTDHGAYDQELEALKKLKLMAKDRMEAILKHARPGVTA